MSAEELKPEVEKRIELLEQALASAKRMRVILTENREAPLQANIDELEQGKRTLTALDKEAQSLKIDLDRTSSRLEWLKWRVWMRRRQVEMLSNYDKTLRPQAAIAEDQFTNSIPEPASIQSLVSFLRDNPDTWRSHRICRVAIILGACYNRDMTLHFFKELEANWIDHFDEFLEFLAQKMPELFILEAFGVKETLLELPHMRKYIDTAQEHVYKPNCRSCVRITRMSDITNLTDARNVLFGRDSKQKPENVANAICAFMNHLFYSIKLTKFLKWADPRTERCQYLFHERERVVTNFQNAFLSLVEQHLNAKRNQDAIACFNRFCDIKDKVEERANLHALNCFHLSDMDPIVRRVCSLDKKVSDRRNTLIRFVGVDESVKRKATYVPDLGRVLNSVEHEMDGFHARSDNIRMNAPILAAIAVEGLLAAQRPLQGGEVDGELMDCLLKVGYLWHERTDE